MSSPFLFAFVRIKMVLISTCYNEKVFSTIWRFKDLRDARAKVIHLLEWRRVYHAHAQHILNRKIRYHKYPLYLIWNDLVERKEFSRRKVLERDSIRVLLDKE